MEFKILAPGANELQLVPALLANFKGHTLPGASIISGFAEFGELTFQNYIGDGFSIWYSNYDIARSTTLIGRGDEALLELHIQFLNPFTTTWDGVAEGVMHQYKYNLSYVPFMSNTAVFASGRTYQTFDVHFTIPYLERLAPYFPPLNDFLEQVVKRNAAKVAAYDRYLTSGMVSIVNDILKCPFRSGPATHFIESKVMELLLFALEELSDNDPLAPIKLSSYDIECLTEAKKLIIEDFQDKISLVQLSRKVGINDYKLKKGFKYLFGSTVGEYLQMEKMARAKQHVLDKELSFADIAILLGYESESSFNKAFKKYFDVTPGYMRSKGG